MRIKSSLIALSVALVCLIPRVTLACSTLTFDDAAGGSTNGVAVYPYVFTVEVGGVTTSNVDLSCLNFNREITGGESWSVNVTSLGSLATTATIDGSTDLQLREDAYLDSLYSTPPLGATDSEIQFAIWDVLDPSGVNGNSGFDSEAQYLKGLAVAAASNESTAFLNQFTLFTPVVPTGNPPANWDGLGEPQEFLEYTPVTPQVPPPATTPEPSSLILLGTGFLSTVLVMRRKLLVA